MNLSRTPLDSWIARELEEVSFSAPFESPRRLKNRQDLERAQERSLRILLRQAAEKTLFYREHLRGYLEAPLEELPFTFPSDLRKGESRFLGVSRSEIERMVSLATSGTRGTSKRLGFTREDLRRTEDFFLLGMSTFTPPKSVVGIFMEGSRPNSIGNLLEKALRRMDCTPHLFGLIGNIPEAAAWTEKIRPKVAVGLPVQMLHLAEESPFAPKVVLLSADMAPPALRKRIERAWNCEIFNHYGLTESGWGCAVECTAHEGCHIRELDLLVEIVDSRGKRLPDNAWGEVVLTTLGRPSFPLIRYRTGDRGRLLSGICPCGSLLKRLEVTGRLPIRGNRGMSLDLYDVENALWSFGEIRDFSLFLEYRKDLPTGLSGILAGTHKKALPLEKVREALRKIPGMPRRIRLEEASETFLRHSKIKRAWNN